MKKTDTETATEKVKIVDLAQLDTAALAEEGAVLKLCHPTTGEELDITITLVGMDSSTYRKAEARLTEKYRRQRGKTRGPEDYRRDAAETAAACTVGWQNVQVDGEDVLCTRENSKALYLRFPWMYEQVQAFIGDRQSFLQD